MTNISLKSKTISFLLLFFFGASLFVFSPPKAHAVLDLSFGGLVLASYECTCSLANWMVLLGPPSPGLYLYKPVISWEYEYYMLPTESIWIVGTYRPPGTCKIYIGDGCVSFPTKGTIQKVGTSL